MRILLLKNNVIDLDTLNKGIISATQHCATIGLDLEFNCVDTDKQFTGIPISSSAVFNTHTINPVEIMTEANKLFFLPHEVNLLVYDDTKILPKVVTTDGSSPYNPTDGGMVICIPTQWYNTYPEAFAETLTHELCHYFFSKTGQPDVTHYYDPAFGQLPRIAYFIYLLKKFMDTTPTVILTRSAGDNKEIIGTLTTADGQFGCSTLERPWLDNKKNISCIPTGQYLCKKTFMIRELTFRYQVMNVPGRTGIFLHSGTFFFDSAGCILLGSQPQDINGDKELDLINTRTILLAFEAKMGGKPFNLVIQ